MLTSPRTTFVGGNNPFAGLYARPVPTLKLDPPIMQKPAKPAAKNAKRLKDEDYTTPYKPPMDAPTLRNSRTVDTAPKREKIRYVDTADLSICDDPLPLGRSIVEGKYDDKFKTMKIGQAVKCPPAAVGLIQNAMRKFVKVRGLKGVVVRTCKDYGDGLGRVWMLAEPAKALKVAA